MTSEEVGRLASDEVGTELVLDDPSRACSAILSKIDDLIVALKAIGDKLDADGGVTDTDYGSTITDALAKLKFKL